MQTDLFWSRITRYDPRYRDAQGNYRAGDWSHVSHVGRSFHGEVLSQAEYDRVERLYGDAVRVFAAESGVAQLEICDATFGTAPSGDPLRDGEILEIDHVTVMVQSLLREEAWCRLETNSPPFAVHVLENLYLWIGSHQRCPIATDTVRASGLFVDEDFPTPLE